MKNIVATVSKDKKKLTLEIDLTQEFGETGSGKSISIASTEGNSKVDGVDGVQFGLNVYRKKADAPKK